MERKNLKIKLLGTAAFLLLLTSSLSAQESAGQDMMKPATGESDTKDSPHSFYAGMTYGSNMIYMGSNVSQDKPFYSGSVMYGYNNELFVSASLSHLSVFDPLISFSTFSAIYNHTFNSWFDISLGLSRYQVNKELADTLFSNFTYGNISIGLDWKILYTSISAGTLFSESSSIYFNVKNSRYFETPHFSKADAFFSFEPYVNLLFGTLTKTTTSEGTSVGVSPPFRPSRSSGQHSSGVTVTTYLGLMEVDPGLTVALNTRKLSVEAEPGFVFPAYSTTSADFRSPKGFTLILSIYYKIF